MHPEPSRYVGIDRRAADVFAALFDDEHIDDRERQRWHEVAGPVGERDLGLGADLLGRESAHLDDVAVGRLERAHATEQATGRLQRDDAVEQPIAHLHRAACVDLGGTRLLAEADHRHLGEPTLDRALEAGVRLDAVDRHDPVGAGRVQIEVQRHAVWGSGNLDGLHGRPDLATDRRLGHAQRLEHLPLAVGGGAAVTTHCRNDERLGAQCAQAGDCTAQQGDALDEPATTGADSDGHALVDRTGELLHHLLVGGRLDVGDGLGVRDGQHHLGECGHGEVMVEGKFDSLEQLFPRVHDRDVNPPCATMVWWNQSTVCTEPRAGWRLPPTPWRGSRRVRVGLGANTPTPPTPPSRYPSRSSGQACRLRSAPGCSAWPVRRSRPRRRARGRSSVTVPRPGQRQWNGSTRPPNPRHRPAGRPDRRARRCVDGSIRSGGCRSASRPERRPRSTSNGRSHWIKVLRRVSRTCQSVLPDVHLPTTHSD